MKMTLQSAATTKEWDKRVARAADLAERFAYAREVLAFYGEVLKLQKRIFQEANAESSVADDAPLRMRLDAAAAKRYLPALLALAEEHGPEKLAEDASAVRAMSPEEQQQMLRKFITGEPVEQPFFARALFQPFAEQIAHASP